MSSRLPPSRVRLRTARASGYVPHSSLLTASLVGATLVGAVWAAESSILDWMEQCRMLCASLGDVSTFRTQAFLHQSLRLCLPIVGACFVVAIVSGLAQTQFHFGWPQRSGFGLSAAQRCAQATFRLFAAFVLVCTGIVQMLLFTQLHQTPPGEAIAQIGQLLGILLAVSFAFGMLDFLLTLRIYRTSLGMTPEEVREEERSRSLSPEIRKQWRSRRLREAREVVLLVYDSSNHVAVALSVVPSDPPRVLLVARSGRYRDVLWNAMERRLLCVEEPPLARRLARIPVQHAVRGIDAQEIGVLAFRGTGPGHVRDHAGRHPSS